MRTLFQLPFLLFTLAAGAQTPCDVTLVGTPITPCPGANNASLSVTTNSGGPYTYSWSHDATATGSAEFNLPPGPYTITVEDPVSGCITVFDTVITDPYVAPLGTINVTNISCAGVSDGVLEFIVNPGPYQWIWLHDPNETNTVVTGLAAGIYGVQITGGGPCPSYLWVELGDPGFTITGETDYCPSDPPILTAELQNGFQPDSYVWSNGGTTNPLQIEPGFSGQIDLVATNTTTGCVVNGSFFLNELPSPTVAMAVPDTTCEMVPTLVQTIATTADSLVWRWGQGNYGFSNAFDPLISFSDPGWQPVSLQGYDTLGCGSAPLRDSIFSQWQVPAIFSAIQDPCTPFVDIVLGSTTDSCAFFIGDSLVTHDCSAYIRWNNMRYDSVAFTLYATQSNGCNDTLEIIVDIRTEPTLFYANAFTPNDDGINDYWPVRIDHSDYGFELKLFDRWGELMWTTQDPNEEWDGKVDGEPAPLGVYVYTVRRRDPCEPTRELEDTGHVTIFR